MVRVYGGPPDGPLTRPTVGLQPAAERARVGLSRAMSPPRPDRPQVRSARAPAPATTGTLHRLQVRQAQGGSAPPVPLLVRGFALESLLSRSPGTEGCVVLGFTGCGGFLLSYSSSFRDGANHFHLQCWRLTTAGATFGLDEADAPRAPVVRGPPPLSFVASCPLFAGAGWEGVSSSGILLDATSVRVALWESPDRGALVVVGSLHERGLRCHAPFHITALPSPAVAYSGGGIAAWLEARPLPVRLSAPGEDSGGEREPSLTALHFSVPVAPPFPRPSVAGFCTLRSSAGGLAPDDCLAASALGVASTYRLVVNTGDGQVVLTLGFKPVGSSPGPPAATASACTCAHCATASLDDAPWHAGVERAATLVRPASLGLVQGLRYTLGSSAIARAVRGQLMRGAGLQAGEEPVEEAMEEAVEGEGGEAEGGEGAPPILWRRTHRANAEGCVTPASALRVLTCSRDPRSLLGGTFLLSQVSLDAEALLASALLSAGLQADRLRNYDARLVCLLTAEEALAAEEGRRGRALCGQPKASPPALEADNEGAVRVSVRPAADGEGAALLLCAIVEYEERRVESASSGVVQQVRRVFGGRGTSAVATKRQRVSTGSDGSTGSSAAASSVTVSTDWDAVVADDSESGAAAKWDVDGDMEGTRREREDSPCADLSLVTAHGPTVRAQLALVVRVCTGSASVLSHELLAPHLQPALDSAGLHKGGSLRTLSSITSAAVNELRARGGLLGGSTVLPRELTNDAVLAGASLTRLISPAGHVAIVL